jgi:hypothetical protein
MLIFPLNHTEDTMLIFPLNHTEDTMLIFPLNHTEDIMLIFPLNHTEDKMLILACYIQHQKSTECKFSIQTVICIASLSTQLCHQTKMFRHKSAHQQMEKHRPLWVERFYVTAGRHEVSIMYFQTSDNYVYHLPRPSKLAQTVTVLNCTVPGVVQFQSRLGLRADSVIS